MHLCSSYSYTDFALSGSANTLLQNLHIYDFYNTTLSFITSTTFPNTLLLLSLCSSRDRITNIAGPSLHLRTHG